MDKELQQISMMNRLLDELVDRLYKLKKTHGDSAKRRAINYVLDRKDWFFDELGLVKKQ